MDIKIVDGVPIGTIIVDGWVHPNRAKFIKDLSALIFYNLSVYFQYNLDHYTTIFKLRGSIIGMMQFNKILKKLLKEENYE